MSLKAKIEAVIYASEEPVTLQQLIGLLAPEAQAELDRLDASQGTLALAAEEPKAKDSSSETTATEQEAEPGDQTTIASGASSTEKKVLRERERRLRELFRTLLDELVNDYSTGDRGLEVREVAGGFRMGTKPEYHDAVRGFVRGLKPPLKLTLQALETLAVVAYKQPVTAPEVSEIRGVDSGGVLGSLLGRKLISTAGRKQVIGRPILYKTTKDFLLRFGLKDLSELPSIEEFEKLAGSMVEQEEIVMSETAEQRIAQENLEAEAGAVEPQADGDSGPLDPTDGGLPGNEEPSVDGRVSGLDPKYDTPEDDPSANEAAIQSGE